MTVARPNTERILAIVIAAVLLVSGFAWADHKPGHGGGGGGNGGGGGGGDEQPPRFTALELPLDGDPFALSEADPDGVITVAIDSSEAGYVSAAFARVNQSTQSIEDYGFLPEPPYADPNDGVFKNGHSGPNDVNDNGTIVGHAAAFETDPDYTGTDISPNRGIVWTYDGTNYSYELLPSLNLGQTLAVGINNLGEIVGDSDGRAVYWDATTHAIEDLNTPETANMGWELFSASDINDWGLIVGRGRLNGVSRGFLLDYASKEIWAVPLVGAADQNGAHRIDATGRIIGTAWNGIGDAHGSDPDFVTGYSWSGPGTAPVILPSATMNTSACVGMNDLGASIGISVIPQGDPFSADQVPTLWEFQDTGTLTTDLSQEIPNKPAWFLLRSWDINNNGWISTYGRKFVKGKYYWRAILLVPTS